jgi:hypothetical protein
VDSLARVVVPPSVTLTATNVSEEVGQKLNPLATKAPFSSVERGMFLADPPLGHEIFTTKTIRLLGVKPVPEIVPAAGSRELPALGRVPGALPLVLERISVGVGVVEIPALFALGGIGGIAAGGRISHNGE